MAGSALGLAAEHIELVQMQIITGMDIHCCLPLMAFIAVVVFMARFT
jgi:hypothetical protein